MLADSYCLGCRGTWVYGVTDDWLMIVERPNCDGTLANPNRYHDKVLEPEATKFFSEHMRL